MLILQGEDDVRVPASQARAFRRACAARGVPCEMVLYPREGHVFAERAHCVDVIRRVMAFCEKCLG